MTTETVLLEELRLAQERAYVNLERACFYGCQLDDISDLLFEHEELARAIAERDDAEEYYLDYFDLVKFITELRQLLNQKPGAEAEL